MVVEDQLPLPALVLSSPTALNWVFKAVMSQSPYQTLAWALALASCAVWVMCVSVPVPVPSKLAAAVLASWAA